jgi:uncharacterized protein (TIGR04222 family)
MQCGSEWKGRYDMDLNPFNLHGPQFLVFYAVLSAAAFTLLWFVQRQFESGDPGDETAWGAGIAKDPYQVGCLRGGRDEVVRVAVVSLVERGLLAIDGGNLKTTIGDAVAKARRPLDKAILSKFAKADTGQSVFSDTIVIAEADAVAATLKDKGLLPDDRITSIRVVTAIAAVGLLWLVAGIKVSVVLSRGRHNIAFLMLMAAAVAVVATIMTKRRRTILGSRTHSYLQSLFADLKNRRDSLRLEGSTGEIAFLTAAFGMATLPAALVPTFEPLRLRPQHPDTSGWSWGTGCGGGGCGGGGGGGCGGGGCGGGCGGCG